MRRARRILLSTFEPFSGRISNASESFVEACPTSLVNNRGEWFEVEKCRLPVAYSRAWPRLSEKIEKFRPEAVICFGEAPRSEICLERRAENLDDARLPDNCGESRVKKVIESGAPQFLYGEFPNGLWLEGLCSAGLRARASTSAGHFLCNHIYYKLLLEHRSCLKLSVFVHLPIDLQAIAERPVPEVKKVFFDLLFELL